ncbi:MAG: GNAT family N-acetyltransferase [bacterium]|nr:GNAT family N-acetyltransferase [bacterium]
MITVLVRDAVHDDIPAIADILMRSSRRAYTFMTWDHNDEDFTEFVRASFDDWDAVRIAQARCRAIGFHCLTGDVVDQLFVVPDAQRHGVGSRLLRDVRALRSTGFTLRTFRANRRARAFYEACGLVAIDFGHSEEENEPDVTYRWRPSSLT